MKVKKPRHSCSLFWASWRCGTWTEGAWGSEATGQAQVRCTDNRAFLTVGFCGDDHPSEIIHQEVWPRLSILTWITIVSECSLSAMRFLYNAGALIREQVKIVSTISWPESTYPATGAFIITFGAVRFTWISLMTLPYSFFSFYIMRDGWIIPSVCHDLTVYASTNIICIRDRSKLTIAKAQEMAFSMLRYFRNGFNHRPRCWPSDQLKLGPLISVIGYLRCFAVTMSG